MRSFQSLIDWLNVCSWQLLLIIALLWIARFRTQIQLNLLSLFFTISVVPLYFAMSRFFVSSSVRNSKGFQFLRLVLHLLLHAANLKQFCVTYHKHLWWFAALLLTRESIAIADTLTRGGVGWSDSSPRSHAGEWIETHPAVSQYLALLPAERAR